ncbi:hypothetical protein [Halobellus rarus]|uniref:DUF7999 domain-containing protein n=1 Tax=Halobellus rarus TaxID=1126237 RepID=A0ABD6CMB2_9EURY|nr:hypothetical protein [Halobellus rarus]
MSSQGSRTRIVVRRPMNSHDTVTVEVCETNETRHLTEYASTELRRTLAVLPRGTTISLAMSRVGLRSNVWRVTGVCDGSSTRSGDDVSPAAPRISR